ncbi:MAG: hypothetical protein L3K09_05790 [Thermoplasmata archaeon]|nr:hypothetical protein [Thermoplasmata archaeon]
MRPVRSNRRGLSEIVGTLFLVLIVVGAATAFAAFVAGYQKQLQAEQQAAHERALESIRVLHLTPTPNGTSGTWGWLNFSLASLDVNPIIVTSISVNDNPVAKYNVSGLNLSTGTFWSQTVLAGGYLSLYPREAFSVNVSTAKGPARSGFYDPNLTLSTSSYLKVELFTYNSNAFTQTFIPPSAVASINYLQTYNGTNITNIPVLDGSSSFQPGNATLVAWIWTVHESAPSVKTWGLSGEKVEMSNLTRGGSYTVGLTVANSDGLLGLLNPALSFVYSG